MKVLAVLVNYGDEQLQYLEEVVRELKDFDRYRVHVILHSNIPVSSQYIDEVKIFDLEDFQLLPMTCRATIWENRNKYDLFIYGENDHLFLQHHLDKHLLYTSILPKNRIPGLIQYEEDETGKYYPGYHGDFEWDFNSVEVYSDKVFAHFNNLHQATFILTKSQLKRIGKRINFTQLVDEHTLWKRGVRKLKNKLGLKTERPDMYSVKCKVNTDIYRYAGYRKLICISEFDDNLIHHLPNLYIDGLKGRNKFRSGQQRMTEALDKLLGQQGTSKEKSRS